MSSEVFDNFVLLAMLIAVILIPFIVVTLVGMLVANELRITGVYWYSFVILFDIIVLSLIGALSRVGRYYKQLKEEE